MRDEESCLEVPFCHAKELALDPARQRSPKNIPWNMILLNVHRGLLRKGH